MRFEDFARLHGLILDYAIEGRWVRVPTTDHPRTRNGAYKFLGDIGWVQNHALSTEVSTWREDSKAPNVRTPSIAKKSAEFERRMIHGWAKAAARAAELMASATQAEHPYLEIKGFSDARGFVLEDGALLIPMRHWQTNKLMGAQIVRWLSDERKYEKKMLPGMRAKGATFRIGSPTAPRTWLVEGYATGLSVEAAIRTMRLRDSVVVCFSAGNMIHVANMLGNGFVFADNDESGAGKRAAETTGFPYCMAGTMGQDANDLHLKDGIFKVASLMMDATTMADTS